MKKIYSLTSKRQDRNNPTWVLWPNEPGCQYYRKWRGFLESDWSKDPNYIKLKKLSKHLRAKLVLKLKPIVCWSNWKFPEKYWTFKDLEESWISTAGLYCLQLTMLCVDGRFYPLCINLLFTVRKCMCLSSDDFPKYQNCLDKGANLLLMVPIQNPQNKKRVRAGTWWE